MCVCVCVCEYVCVCVGGWERVCVCECVFMDVWVSKHKCVRACDGNGAWVWAGSWMNVKRVMCVLTKMRKKIYACCGVYVGEKCVNVRA